MMRSFVFILMILFVGGCSSVPELQYETSSAWLKRREAEATPATLVLDSPLTLEGAKRIALEGNPDLTAAQARIDQAHARLNQARSAYVPTVELSSAYVHTEWQSVPGSPLGNAGRSQIFTSGLGATWLLYDGLQREFSELAARYGRDAATDGLVEGQRMLCRGVAQAFLSALLQQELMNVAQADADFNLKLLKQAKEKRELGADARADELTFQLQYNLAQINLSEARNNWRLARIGLAELLGLPRGELEEKIGLAGSEDNGFALTIDELLKDALERSDVRIQVSRLQAMEATALARRGDLHPTLAATGNYGYTRENDMRYTGEDRDGSLGVVMQWDLDVGGRRWQAYQEAKAAVVEAEAQLERTRLGVYSEVRQIYENLANARADLKLREDSAKIARELRDLEEEKWKLGAISITRLNEVQTNLVRADGYLLVSRIQVQIYSELLRASAGRNIPGK